MVEEGHFESDKIKSRLGQLHDHWNQLKEKASQRRQDLEDSLQAHQYFADANEAESWMKEKEPLAGNVDYGKDEDTSEALLKRHEAFMSDLTAFNNTIAELKAQAVNCRQQETPMSDITGKEMVQVRTTFKNCCHFTKFSDAFVAILHISGILMKICHCFYELFVAV